jgi:hypothetical protein
VLFGNHLEVDYLNDQGDFPFPLLPCLKLALLIVLIS